ncbi:MAG TPA: NAD(P)/FAD-dependent oxidoreductase, partial [Chloroflexota bacterium]|nr:NAD(P)/FAD-dependent oxidoreductase [Chloroflexota bacterium]
LVNRARRAGAMVVEGFRAIAVAGDRDATMAVAGLREDGSIVTHRSRLVVGADGVRSAIARSLQLTLPVRWPRRLGLVAHYEGVAGLGNTGEMHVAKDSYCGLAPQPEGLTNVALVVGLDAVRRSGLPVEAFFERSLAAMPGIAQRLHGACRIDRVRGVGPLAQRVRRASATGALLVGDAAGFLDPFTGEGIYKALRGAEIAADVAHTALRQGDVRSTSLAQYDQARRDAFRAKDALSLLVQMFIGATPLLEYTATRLADRPTERLLLGSALGDCRPAREALTPRFLWSMLRP